MIKNIDHNNVINYGTDSIIIKSAVAGFGKPICMKILTEEFPASEIVAQLENEFEICSKVNCASIRKAYKKEKVEDHLVLELEYIDGKDLNKFLATEKIDFLQQLNLAVDLVTALTDLQRENIFFRQVHPSNILIEQSTHKIFFIDFGRASHSPYEYEVPDFVVIPIFSPRAISSPSREIPSLYIRSNSVCLKGAATLFFTTFTRILPPIISSPFFICALRRISRRTDA